MVRVDPDRQTEYREAWDAWQRQLRRLHDVFLDGERMPPPQLKGLLNREARSKQRYDDARSALLGIGQSSKVGAGAPNGRIGRVPPPSIDSEPSRPPSARLTSD